MFLQTANEKVWQVIITTFVDGWMRFTLFSNLSLTKKSITNMQMQTGLDRECT